MNRIFQQTVWIAALSGVALLSTPETSFGHGACNTLFNAKCDGQPRWMSEARLFSFGVLMAAQATTFQCTPYYHAAYVSRDWGWQHTKYTAGIGCQKNGWKKRWYQSRGDEFSPLVNEFIGDMISGDADDEDYSDELNSEEATVSEREATIDYKARTITVSGINAKCRVLEGQPVYSTIRYEVWQATGDDDSTFDPKKVIYSTHFTIRGMTPRPSASGSLSGVRYELFSADGYRNLVISEGSVVLPIPDGADISHIGLRLVSDGGGDEVATMKKAISNSDKALADNGFVFDVFPNPATTQFSIRLTAAAQSTADIRIYDAMGKEVVSLARTALSANQSNTIKVETAAWAAGIYYIVVRTADQKYVKQISTIK